VRRTFPEEHQTEEGEALRNDDDFASVFAWEFKGNGTIETPTLHREPLNFENVELAQRSYK
jgi:succinate dehydrogenase / fumarate reductase flavoprotein subunit